MLPLTLEERATSAVSEYARMRILRRRWWNIVPLFYRKSSPKKKLINSNVDNMTDSASHIIMRIDKREDTLKIAGRYAVLEASCGGNSSVHKSTHSVEQWRHCRNRVILLDGAVCIPMDNDQDWHSTTQHSTAQHSTAHRVIAYHIMA